MKFSSNKSRFWRERGDCCLFFEQLAVLNDDGECAELTVSWCKQLDKGWKKLGTENIRIRSTEYPKWGTYFPRGDDLSEVRS